MESSEHKVPISPPISTKRLVFVMGASSFFSEYTIKSYNFTYREKRINLDWSAWVKRQVQTWNQLNTARHKSKQPTTKPDNYTCTWKISAIWFISVKLRINRSTLKDIVSLHRTAPNWINYILNRKKNYNKSNILRLATQYSLNLFVKRYNVIVNKHCWIIKHPCLFRINWYRSRKVLPCKTRN